MKKLLLVLTVTALTIAVQADDKKAAPTCDKSKASASCCEAKKAETAGCKMCPSKAKDVQASKPALSPKAAADAGK